MEREASQLEAFNVYANAQQYCNFCNHAVSYYHSSSSDFQKTEVLEKQLDEHNVILEFETSSKDQILPRNC